MSALEKHSILKSCKFHRRIKYMSFLGLRRLIDRSPIRADITQTKRFQARAQDVLDCLMHLLIVFMIIIIADIILAVESFSPPVH